MLVRAVPALGGSDPGRLGAIETRRREDPVALLADVEAGIAAAGGLCRSLDSDEWRTSGLHPVIGAMRVSAIVERFLVGHLEEHATQLDELVPLSGPSGAPADSR